MAELVQQHANPDTGRDIRLLRSTNGWGIAHPIWPILAYAFATLATRAYFLGDTIDYADSVASRISGRDYYFWEFGHLLWRPVGFLTLRLSQPLVAYVVGDNLRTQATLVLVLLSWFSGILSVWSLHALLRQTCRKSWLPLAMTISFMVALSFLNYFHSGTPYVPGLSMTLLALCILNTGRNGEVLPSRAVLGGLVLAAGICLWFPYVVISPAVVLSPGFVHGLNRPRLLSSVKTLILAGFFTLAAYLPVAWHIGAHSPAQFESWMRVTSGDPGNPNKGITKAVFGFARAFVSMGNDGVLFKRYLLRDPLNPVTVFDLLKFSLWKLISFYLFLMAIVLALLTSAKGQYFLGLLFVAGFPTLAFAVYWQGGDPERYLALFPFVFWAAAVSLEISQRAVLRWTIAGFLIVASFVNVIALSVTVIHRQQQQSASRVNELLPNLEGRSRIVTANWQDDLVNFSRTFPFDPINRRKDLLIQSVISPGASGVERWRESFTNSALSTIRDGGQVWLSTRLWSPRPRPEWNWVEGDDPRVSWTDLYGFFSRLDVGQPIGGDDGFVLLLSSDGNKQILADVANKK